MLKLAETTSGERRRIFSHENLPYIRRLISYQERNTVSSFVLISKLVPAWDRLIPSEILADPASPFRSVDPRFVIKQGATNR